MKILVNIKQYLNILRIKYVSNSFFNENIPLCNLKRKIKYSLDR